MSNFGPITRDHFSKNVHIKGATVIDSNRNITGNCVTSEKIVVTGNAVIGNLTSDNLIVANTISATLFIGQVYGNIYDETGTQLLKSRQPTIENPNVISSFIPGPSSDASIVVPSVSMPNLGAILVPMSTDIRKDSVTHLLYYNHIQLTNEVASLRAQVVEMLNMLKTHGIINSI
jgi:hypothetical protein